MATRTENRSAIREMGMDKSTQSAENWKKSRKITKISLLVRNAGKSFA
jgi:hypothetical protein